MQPGQGGGLSGSPGLVPKRQGLRPALHTRCTTLLPVKRKAQLARSAKALFRLNPFVRVEALKKTTGAILLSHGGTWAPISRLNLAAP